MAELSLEAKKPSSSPPGTLGRRNGGIRQSTNKFNLSRRDV
jgi:hypothetical protein